MRQARGQSRSCIWQRRGLASIMIGEVPGTQVGLGPVLEKSIYKVAALPNGSILASLSVRVFHLAFLTSHTQNTHLCPAEDKPINNIEH